MYEISLMAAGPSGGAFERLAIVDRGEAAMRLILAAREYDAEHDTRIRTIALYAGPDRLAPFVREADEAYALDAGAPFLDVVERALVATGADAVWPGWGSAFWSPELAELCARLGIVFVGPTAGMMRALGDGIEARRRARALGLPVTPWSDGAVEDVEEARAHAARIGYPLLVKAVVGGGRGPCVAGGDAELADAVERSRREARNTCGDGRVFLERLVPRARHLEVQVVADGRTCWPLGVRDCSIRRRHQTILAETPSPALSPGESAALEDAAVRLCRSVHYRSAGTVGFLFDPERREAAFTDVQPWLQAEHPVTEAVTGVDLVKLQLHVARGGRLADRPPSSTGHAIAVRLDAEDPDDRFTPTPGRVALLRVPGGPGLRVDGGVEEGDDVPAGIDATIATIVAHGASRGEALARLRRTLAGSAVVVDGGATNRAFLLRLVDHAGVRRGDHDLEWLDRVVASAELEARPHADVALLAAAVEAYESEMAIERARFLSVAARGQVRVSRVIGRTIELRHRGHAYVLDVRRLSPERFRIEVDGARVDLRLVECGRAERRLSIGGRSHRVASTARGAARLVEVDGVPHTIARERAGIVHATTPGIVTGVLVGAGDRVSPGDRLVVIEAMKTEHSISGTFTGTVRAVMVHDNVQVDAGAPLLEIAPDRDAVDVGAGDRVSFATLAALVAGTPGSPPARAACLNDARCLMLGYDVEPAELRRRLAEHGALCDTGHGTADRPGALQAGEDAILAIFADLRALFRRQRGEEDDDTRRSREEHFVGLLRDLDGGGAQLPRDFLTKLARALAHYDVHTLRRTPALEEALFRIVRSQRLAAEQAPVVGAILQRRLEETEDGSPDPHLPELLARLESIAHGSFPRLDDLARALRYRVLERPLLDAARRHAREEAESHLAWLDAHPNDEDRAAHVAALVHCPQPLHGLISARAATGSPHLRRCMLEVMTRRYYREHALTNVHGAVVDGLDFLCAGFRHEGSLTSVLAAHAPAAALPRAIGALAALAATLPTAGSVVADLYAWTDDDAGEPSPDARAAAIRTMLDEALAHPRDGRPRVERVVVVLAAPAGAARAEGDLHFSFRADDDGYREERLYGGVLPRALHPMMAERLHLWRLARFDVERLPSAEDVYLLRAVARSNPRDERLVGIAEVRDLTPVRDAAGKVVQLPHLEQMLMEVLAGMRREQARRDDTQRLLWNRVQLLVWPPIRLRRTEMEAIVRALAPATEGLGIESVTVHARVAHPVTGVERETVLTLRTVADGGIQIRFDLPDREPIEPLSEYEQRVLRLKQRGLVDPYELVRMLTPPPGTASALPPGDFQEYDLDASGELAPVARPHGHNTANVVVGTVRSYTATYPEGMRRVIVLGDPTSGMGNLAEPECRRIEAALALAARLRVPVEWFALSAGARIALDSGTENMDWIALVLRRIVELTQAGGEINIVSIGINVGAQPYWNAEATMLMHTRGILVMTPEAAMVLTGKQALDYSGGVSAEDNFGIGGLERIMGPNGQAQYGARDLTDACRILLRHYEHTYVAPGEWGPRRAATGDPRSRDVCRFAHGLVDGCAFRTVGEIFSDAANPGRKRPFDIRRVMRAVTDQDHEPLERWYAMREAETAVVWDARVGGHAVCLLGFESRPMPRLGFVPADGPATWTGGTLFPRSSKKIARAINAASGNRPVVVLANLSGFDGSPESMRNWQLEYGAELGRAVVNFRGPIVFVVVSRYHGGAFVVFSNRLRENMEIAAIEGSHASVIGGAPAAAVVFAREVQQRAAGDPRLAALAARVAAAAGAERVRLQARLDALHEEVHAEQLGRVAEEFDTVHSVQRALRVGSVHRIIAAAELRPYVIDAVERGLRREIDERSLSTAGRVAAGVG